MAIVWGILAISAIVGIFLGLFWLLPGVNRNDDSTHGGGDAGYPTSTGGGSGEGTGGGD